MAKRTKKKKNLQGSVLLLAILVMAGVTAAGLGMANLLIKEIRQARTLDNAIVAYYAAESGIEDGLYHLRKEGYEVEDLVVEHQLENGAEWKRVAKKKEEGIFTGIEANQIIQFDVFNPQQSATGQQVATIQVDWNGDGSEWLEVTWLSWQGGSSLIGSPSKRLLSHALTGSRINLAVAGVSERSDFYRIRIRAMYSDVSDLSVTAFDSDGNVIEIPTIVVLSSIGKFSDTQQILKINMPLNSPVIGLFDYVLFIESSIIK